MPITPITPIPRTKSRGQNQSWRGNVAAVDLVIAGGGIVGLATAYRFLERFPDRTVVVLEKEAAVAEHQTGRNS
ncbi:MAG: FAD-dependent oxidoreductase, partial [Planctomycetaceae bacterium]